jgi:predicted DNA-binding protein
MDYSQTNIRLSHQTISRLKAQAERHGLSYSSMCEQILEEGVSRLDEESSYQENHFLLADNALRAKIDIANSRLRSISKKENKDVTYHEYPQEIAAYIFNQHCNGGGFS